MKFTKKQNIEITKAKIKIMAYPANRGTRRAIFNLYKNWAKAQLRIGEDWSLNKWGM